MQRTVKSETDMAQKLTEALEEQRNDINSYIWKGAKQTRNGQVIQEEIKLMDASPSDLQKFYAHCNSMLYNKDKINPGRYVLLKIIKEQIHKCNIELFLRYIENTYKPTERERYPRFNYMSSIKECIELNKLPKNQLSTISITEISNGVPEEFNNLSIDSVIDGCLDKLGSFDKRHLTLSFIIKMGIWLTSNELRDLTEHDDNGKVRNRLTVIKERLNLKDINLRIDPTGLNYAEFKAMIQLKSKKYSELTVDQLVVLHDKILFRFAEEVERHAEQWEERKHQIEAVVEARQLDCLLQSK